MKRSKEHLNEMKSLRATNEEFGEDSLGYKVRAVLHILTVAAIVFTISQFISAATSDKVPDRKPDRFYDDGFSREFYDTGKRKFYDND